MLGSAVGRNMVPVTESFDRVSKITKQVPSIGDLNATCSTVANTVGASASTVAGNNFDPWAVPQPIGNGRRLVIGQEVDNFIRLQVDNCGPVAATTLPCPIIHTRNTRRGVHPVRAVF
jgi:hypothetical protein